VRDPWSYFLTTANDGQRLHRIAVDDEPAVIAADLSTELAGQRAAQCLTLVACAGKTPSGDRVETQS
jgi:hypothetical protein